MYYIIRANNYIGAFYHIRQRGVIRRIYLKGRWQAEECIAENCRENFTVHYEKEIIYIFCQDSQGDIISVTINDTDNIIKRRVVLKNQYDHIVPVTLYPIITEKELVIIYNSANIDDKSNYLMIQKLNENARWESASRIDKYWSDSFDVQRAANDHLLLFYQTRSPENNLGYREITPSRQSDYITYYTTKYYIPDTSCLTTDEGVHTLFVVRSMFSCQLIYRRNMTGSFTGPIVLYEAQRIENCLLFIVKGHLFITFVSSGNLYICVSEDNGASFSQPVRYRNKFCQNPEKAFFITQESQSEKSVFLRQVYVDRSSPWDVQIIPELSEDFFPAYAGPANENINAYYDTGTEYIEEIERLRNQIEVLNRREAEKDIQIANLSRLLSERNREFNEALRGQAPKSVSVGENIV